MNQAELIELIKSFDLFEKLDDDTLRDIASELEIEDYPEHAIIVNQGDEAEKVYFVLDGIAEVFVINKHGQEVVVGSLTSGNYFGELALLISTTRTASVRAKTHCHFATLTKNKFNNILDHHLSASRAMSYVLSHRLSRTLHLISEKSKNIIILLISSEEAKQRVDHFENYFRKMSNKPVLIYEDEVKSEDIVNINKKLENNYILIKSLKLNPSEFLLKYADHVINFVEKRTDCICLTEGVSLWAIEHTVRRITKKTVGIALCSGGAPAAAHLGVLKVLHEEGIPLDYIVGSSSGAFYGGGYAFNCPVEDMIKLMLETTNKSQLVTVLSYFNFNLSGILTNNFLRKLVRKMIGQKDFADASIPFAAVSSDLYTGKTVVIKSGDAVEGIVASNAAPVIVQPIQYGENLLIDGVATSPLPIKILIEEGIDIKIAVPISQLDLSVSITKKSKLFAIFLRSRSMMAEQIMNLSTELADVIITPQTSGIKLNDWKNIHNAIQAGEDAARIAIKRIRYLLERHVFYS